MRSSQITNIIVDDNVSASFQMKTSTPNSDFSEKKCWKFISPQNRNETFKIHKIKSRTKVTKNEEYTSSTPTTNEEKGTKLFLEILNF